MGPAALPLVSSDRERCLHIDGQHRYGDQTSTPLSNGFVDTSRRGGGGSKHNRGESSPRPKLRPAGLLASWHYWRLD